MALPEVVVATPPPCGSKATSVAYMLRSLTRAGHSALRYAAHKLHIVARGPHHSTYNVHSAMRCIASAPHHVVAALQWRCIYGTHAKTWSKFGPHLQPWRVAERPCVAQITQSDHGLFAHAQKNGPRRAHNVLNLALFRLFGQLRLEYRPRVTLRHHPVTRTCERPGCPRQIIGCALFGIHNF